MTGSELLKIWYDRVWIQADMNAVMELFDCTALAQGLMPDLAMELEDFNVIVPEILRSVRDIEFSFLDTLDVEDRAWARIRMNAKRAQDLQPIEIYGQVVIRHKDGKIIEAYNNFDLMSYFEQMGNLPESSVSLCLAGEKFR